MKKIKLLLISTFIITNISIVNAQVYTGIFKTTTNNTDYHHFTRSGTGAAVYINQVSTGPILKLSSGTFNANYNVKFTVENNGNVGIGTTNPLEKLHVYGNVSIYNANNQGNGFGTDSDGNFIIYRNAVSNNTKSLVINDGNGNIGIGKDSPEHKLDVAGTIQGTAANIKGKLTAQEVVVELAAPAPDYVFEPDYNLLSLSEVEAYVKENKHLPDVPAGKTMEQEGVSVAEMNMLLLQKVEEMTLYMIELQKQVTKQNQRIKELEIKDE